MSVFKPIKATSLPGTPAPDAVYFIKAGSSAIVRIYVTDSTGTAYLVGQIVDSPFTPTNTAVTVGDTFQTIAEKLQGQVTNIAQNYLQLSGGTMTGYISLHADPTQAFHAATKQYVDNVAEGLHIHASVKVATTTTLASSSGGTVTYNNGTNGLGATLTLSNALSQLDGYSLVNADRVLIKNETNKAHNGLYVRTSSTVFTRASDYDTVTEIKSGDFVFVSEGVQGGKTGWVQISSVSTIGTDNIEWQQFSGAGTYVGSTSIVLNANSFERAALIGDVTSAQNSNTLTIANNAVSNEKFRQSSGFSVVGRAVTGTGNVADIVAGTDGVLRRSGSGDLAFGTLVTNNVGDSQITYAKIQNVTADRILGRITTTGVAQELTATQVRTLLNVADGANNYVLPTATSTVLGGIEIFSDTVQSVASNAVSATASRTYGIQLNSSGQAVVNVPWANTEYTGSTSIILTGGSFERAALTGDVTATQNSNATTIASKAVTYAKIQDVATSRMLGRVTAGTGVVEELTASQVRSFLNVADGADNYSSWLLAASGTAGTASITSGATVTLTAGTGMTVTRSSNNVTFATTITQYTDALARAAISLTTTGTSGAATYNNSTGVLNIPQYQTALTNPVTGTGANGQVSFWTGTGTQSGSNNLFWNNSNNRLGIGTTSPSQNLNVVGSTGLNGLVTITGTTATDSGQLGSELLTTGTGDASWTGSDFATGYTHVAGSTTTLTSTLAGVVNNSYQIAYTVTNRTAGSFTIAFGGFTSGALTATGAVGPMATTTDTLVITPTSDFNGTIVLSIRVISTSSASVTFANSSGVTTNQIRISSIVNNTFIGFNAGRNVTTGGANSFYGRDSGVANTTGGSNSFFGFTSGGNNNIGSNNSFFGTIAGQANTTGNNNSGFGMFSGLRNITGSNNVFFGYEAGAFLANGSNLTEINNSIFIGFSTRTNGNSQTNQIVIGHQAVGLGSNTTVIGNSSTAFGRWWGNLLLGTSTNSGDRLRVDGTVRFDSVTNATGDIVTIDANNVLRRRTATELRGDIGAGASTADITAVSLTSTTLTLTRSDGNLTASVPTFNQNTTGSAATLTTARTLTIGSTGKTFDGSGNVSWTLNEIGAAATVHTHVVSDIVSLTAKRLIGRHTNSSGAGEQISLANNLAISDAGVLSVEWVETAW